jgi:hypothetical protein
MVHQFAPGTGEKIFTSKNEEIALWNPRMIGDKLVALAFTREEGKPLEEEIDWFRLRTGPPLGELPRGKCIGMVGIRMK